MVERNLAKVEVESSRLFSRSSFQGVPEGHPSSSSGEVAKRLCSGLQSRLDGFDSRPRLQMKKIAHFRVGYFFVSRPAAVSIAHDPQNPLFIVICMLCFWKALCIAASFRDFLVVLEHHVAMVRGRLAVGR